MSASFSCSPASKAENGYPLNAMCPVQSVWIAGGRMSASKQPLETQLLVTCMADICVSQVSPFFFSIHSMSMIVIMARPPFAQNWFGIRNQNRCQGRRWDLTRGV